MAAYALTIFTGAFLLFLVQPLMGRYILPWFGGGPGVWTTCLLFFQVVLLAGYAYAHLLSQRLRPRWQAIVHCGLLLAALASLPITPSDAWKPAGGGYPAFHILLLLAVNLGLPYFALSSTGPLMQEWFSRAYPGASPYRLYALSNLGSLLALASFPFYMESHFTRKAQALIWGWGLLAYAMFSAFCALKLWRFAKASTTSVTVQASGKERRALASAWPAPSICAESPSSRSTQLLWLLLPACASALLLATTNKLCLDMAAIPFLWVLPLALYLLSFIICFDHPRWYARFPASLALVAALSGLCWAIFKGYYWPLARLVTVYCGALFGCCMVCHGELYRLRPHPRHLTRFYLMIAAGGALGSVFVALIAPALFTGYYELHAGALLCAVLFLAICLRDRNPLEARQWYWMFFILPSLGLVGLDFLLVNITASSTPLVRAWVLPFRGGLWLVCLWLVWRALQLRRREPTPERLGVRVALPFAQGPALAGDTGVRQLQTAVCFWVGLGVVALATTLWFQRERFGDKVVHASRNFYGVLRVLEHVQQNPPQHFLWLRHGRISHGFQSLEPSETERPSLYYGEKSGVGAALQALPASPRRVGIIGLGAGTLAAYCRPGDYFRFYEINPRVKQLALSPFSYLTTCRGKAEVVLGDALLSMEREAPQNLDLLVLDAFSSDAIPVHLLTTEAFEIYARHLKQNGLIAVHISNNYLDLEPVLAGLACRFDYTAAVIDRTPAPEEWWLKPSVWVLLSHAPGTLDSPAIRSLARPLKAVAQDVPVWTDDFSSLYQVLK